MKKDRYIISAVIISLLAVLLVSCGKKEQEASDTYRVYYPDSSYTSLLSEEAVITEGDIAGSLLGLLAAKPANTTGVAAISGNVVLMGWKKENGRDTSGTLIR